MKGKARKFEDNYDKKRTESTGLQFEQALAWVLQSDASTKMPKFARGTLPEEFKFSPAKSVDTVRKNMGDELWFQSFTLSRMRHKMSHAYEMVGDEDDDASSDDSKASATEEKLALPEVKTEPPAKPNKQKQSPPVRIELDLGVHEEVEVPREDFCGPSGGRMNCRRQRNECKSKQDIQRQTGSQHQGSRVDVHRQRRAVQGTQKVHM